MKRPLIGRRTYQKADREGTDQRKARIGYRLTMLAVWVLATLLYHPISVSEGQGEPLRIAVATSAQGALSELAALFETTHGVPVEVVSGSTGKLYAQIFNGAPFDLFFAADLERPRLLVEHGVADALFVYAQGQLAFWAAGREDWRDRTLVEVLGDPALRRVALANPRVAPYGAAARDLLLRLGSPVPTQRLVYGENVAQSLQLVASGAADAGFIALSQVSGGPLDGATQIWPVDRSETEGTLEHGAVRIRRSRHSSTSSFLAFVQSSRGSEILTRRGLPTASRHP